LPAQLPPWLDRALGLARVDFAPSHRQASAARVLFALAVSIGVVIACLAWPVVTRISSAPRWLFFRLAVLVTLVLWLPDLYLLDLGQPGRAVAVLMVMHLAIALVTYCGLVYSARVGPAARHAGHARVAVAGPDRYAERRR
jgi:CDP-diglyceride synthetase